MKYDLDPAREIIKTFLAERDEIKIMRQGISAPLPALSFRVEDRSPVFDSSEFTSVPDSFNEKADGSSPSSLKDSLKPDFYAEKRLSDKNAVCRLFSVISVIF